MFKRFGNGGSPYSKVVKHSNLFSETCLFNFLGYEIFFGSCALFLFLSKSVLVGGYSCWHWEPRKNMGEPLPRYECCPSIKYQVNNLL